ncbi:MAG TPA: hypothetical protein VIJ38_01705 [Acidobacteriaceae bacterium]
MWWIVGLVAIGIGGMIYGLVTEHREQNRFKQSRRRHDGTHP